MLLTQTDSVVVGNYYWSFRKIRNSGNTDARVNGGKIVQLVRNVKYKGESRGITPWKILKISNAFRRAF